MMSMCMWLMHGMARTKQANPSADTSAAHRGQCKGGALKTLRQKR